MTSRSQKNSRGSGLKKPKPVVIPKMKNPESYKKVSPIVQEIIDKKRY